MGPEKTDMDGLSRHSIKLPPEQRAIRAKCFHPSGTFVEFPIEDVETSIPSRFEKIVGMYPNRLAVKMGERALTYAELNQAANRIAWSICHKRGAGIEPILLLSEHGLDGIASCFGILKAGKILVVIDPSFPLERIGYMMANSQAGAIVTDGINVSLAKALAKNDVQVIDTQALGSNLPEMNLGLQISPDMASQIVYSSGSTGQPKGIVFNHRRTLHDVKVDVNATHICPDDRIIQFRNLSFSAGTKGLFRVLLSGASFFPYEINRAGLSELVEFLTTEKITIFSPGISIFRHFVDHLDGKESFPSIRLIILGCEAIFRDDIEAYKKIFPDDCLWLHHLSSSEAGLVCQYFIDKDTELDTASAPVGYPVDGKEVFLQDESGNKVDYGQAGEIVVRSRYLSSGYWRKSELTGPRFLADPACASERLYLTGDLGRLRPDGCLVYLGRKDFVVKIRGYTVEIDAIERTLAEHPEVKEVGVAALDRDRGVKYLAAYVVPRDDVAPTIDELRRFLKQKLPDYMVPSAFMFVESLPLTNGKLDRKALPKLDDIRPALSQPYMSARSDVEITLAQIWEDVLNIHPIGIYDNFFDLGGHSLLVMRIASRVVHDFQVDLPTKLFFESPTIASQAEYIEGARHKGSKSTTPFIPVVSRQRQLPLSFGQERLWFLNQLEPASSLYNEPRALRLIGFLDIEAFERTLNYIIARHEVLRTTIVLVDGNPMQRIADHRTIELPVLDLRTHSADDRDTKARRLLNEMIRRPFDLSSDLMLRALLLRMDYHEHILLVVRHHIASDGWSGGIFWQEVAALYQAFASGRSADLRELPVQYADYAAWQREWLQGELLETQLSYWRKQLDNLTTLQLPTDRPRPAIPSFEGARQTLVLPKDLSQALRALSRNEGVTLFMTLLTAFQILLHRYTGQEDIAVGSLISGRNRAEIERLLGFFVNTLVLRTDVSDVPTFRELLQRVRGVCLGAYSHQDLPFEKLVQELQPDRNLNSNPLFQVLFQLSNGPRTLMELPAIEVEDMDLDGGISKFDLSLSMADKGDEITGRIEYNTDLFNAETIERMLGHFHTLLEGIVANPLQRISGLPLLREAEKRQLVIEWNDTKREYPKGKCIHQLFEEQVERTPDAVAVVFEDQQLTYQELNRRANQVAHYLRKRGVTHETPVAISLERSLETVVAALAVLKAGGCYVPLDPDYPKERLVFMLRDTQSPLLLTQLRVRERLSELKIEIMCLDIDWNVLAQECVKNPRSQVTPENLAYVIYTSGSTGTPKGVAVSHRAVNRLVMNTDYVQVSPQEVMAQASNVSFDAATFEIWGALLNGARLVSIAKDTLLSPQSLSTAIDRHGITTLFLTTALFNEMVEQIPAALGKLRHLLFGGEAVDAQRVKELLENGPPRRLLHVYGPTETTTFATWYWVKAVAADATTVPIGRPIANTEIYILDAHLNPVPIGVSGELYIGGPGVARGYLNRPELTAENFIKHPFTNDPQARLYKTGDRARSLPEGNIELLGRLDDQVKIRGYRIELGEIETVLALHSAVREAVVLAREESPGDKRLVAYVVPNQEPTPAIHEFRSFLRQKLPEYMIPSMFVYLDTLPLTPNGKLDRKALPGPDQSRPEFEEPYTAPRTPTEEILAKIWAEVLKVEKVGIHGNFFNLGGHSLLATQAMSRIHEALKPKLPLRFLFEAPTVAELALRIEQSVSAGDELEELACKLAEVELLSDEEAERHLAEENT